MTDEVSKNGLTPKTAKLIVDSFNFSISKQDFDKELNRILSEALSSGEISQSEKLNAQKFIQSKGVLDTLFKKKNLEEVSDFESLPNKKANLILQKTGLETFELTDIVEKNIGKDFECSPDEFKVILDKINKKIKDNNIINDSELKLLLDSLGITLKSENDVPYGKQTRVAGGSDFITNELEAKMDELDDMATIYFTLREMKYPRSVPEVVSREINGSKVTINYDKENSKITYSFTPLNEGEGEPYTIEEIKDGDKIIKTFIGSEGVLGITEILTSEHQKEITEKDKDGNIKSIQTFDFINNRKITKQLNNENINGLGEIQSGIREEYYNKQGILTSEIKRDLDGTINTIDEYIVEDGVDYVVHKNGQGETISKRKCDQRYEKEFDASDS